MPPDKTTAEPPRQAVRESSQLAQTTSPHLLAKRILAGVGLFVAVWLAWISLEWAWTMGRGWVGGVVGLVIIGLLVFLAAQNLAFFSIPKSWLYRGALLTGLLVPFFRLVSMQEVTIFSGLLLGASSLGAFFGGVAATILRDGYYEDNLPPPSKIKDEVHQWHQEKIGGGMLLPVTKRLFDIGFAAMGLVLSAPLCLVITLLIWLDDPGPFLFVKNSVGKGGKNFHQYKFRTLIRDAERTTGPTLTGYEDERILWVGRILRKTALDELPQLINIFRGEMSFVGPRPQRTVLVHGYLSTVPGYAERHRVPPGLAGLAQVVGSYFMTPSEKLHWDQIYIERISLGFDLKLILLAFLVVFWLRWQKDWDEHLPDRYLRLS